eukprot:5847881-Pleurochrysis_carterae.AAC.1
MAEPDQGQVARYDCSLATESLEDWQTWIARAKQQYQELGTLKAEHLSDADVGDSFCMIDTNDLNACQWRPIYALKRNNFFRINDIFGIAINEPEHGVADGRHPNQPSDS